jgi:hypothetical protein
MASPTDSVCFSFRRRSFSTPAGGLPEFVIVDFAWADHSLLLIRGFVAAAYLRRRLPFRCWQRSRRQTLPTGIDSVRVSGSCANRLQTKANELRSRAELKTAAFQHDQTTKNAQPAATQTSNASTVAELVISDACA